MTVAIWFTIGASLGFAAGFIAAVWLVVNIDSDPIYDGKDDY